MARGCTTGEALQLLLLLLLYVPGLCQALCWLGTAKQHAPAPCLRQAQQRGEKYRHGCHLTLLLFRFSC